MKPYFISLFFTISLFLFTGCASKTAFIEGFHDVPQSSAHFLPESPTSPLLSTHDEKKMLERFRQKFFSPWNLTTPPAKKGVFWANSYVKNRQGYAENTLPYTSDELESILQQTQTGTYPARFDNAIMVRSSDVRTLPTDKPFFLDFERAGEGYPFDYLQNSRIHIGKPVKIIHTDSTGFWVYIWADSFGGWVPYDHVAKTSPEFETSLQNASLLAITQDHTTLQDFLQLPITQAGIGTLLPLNGKQDGLLIASVPSRNPYGNAYWQESLLTPEQAQPFPLPLHAQNIASMIDSLLGQRYGWGGMYGNRDCSAFLRDIFAPFGLYLPRNSRGQANAGKKISLSQLNTEEKEQLLRKQGIPFLSLLHAPGHIMLYLGHDEKHLYIAHSLWGIKTKEWFHEGRQIIGQSAITSIRLGENLFFHDRHKRLIDRIDSLTILQP